MFIFQFIEDFCRDIVEKVSVEKQLVDLSEFPHDGTITDAEGNIIPIVAVDGVDIPVSDFLTLDKVDFTAVWKTPNMAEAFDNYISTLEIIEGEEAVSRIRKNIMNERDRLSQDVELTSFV